MIFFLVTRNVPRLTAPSTVSTAGLTRLTTRVPLATVGTIQTAPSGIAEVTNITASYGPRTRRKWWITERGDHSPDPWQHEPSIGQHLWEMISVLSIFPSNMCDTMRK